MQSESESPAAISHQVVSSPYVAVQTADFDVSAEMAALQAACGDQVGAVASFVGTVRGADIASLYLEHYPAMTEKALYGILDAALARFAIVGARIIHRVGDLPSGANIVLVLVASSHRQAALDAVAFIMDHLKTRAPFWKRETLQNGQTRWVEAKPADDAALANWNTP